jgi:hypothetical protein
MVKTIFFITLFLISSATQLFSSKLDRDIEALKKAPKEKRYILMNRIKVELLKLNESQRREVMEKLFKTFNKHGSLHNDSSNHIDQNCNITIHQKHTEIEKKHHSHKRDEEKLSEGNQDKSDHKHPHKK